MSAGYAPKGRLALAALRSAVPADATGLRRVRRFDFLDTAGGLVLQTTYQLAPAIGQDPPVETSLGTAPIWQVGAGPVRGRLGLGAPRHLGDPQVFHADDVEPPGEIRAGLLDPVLTTVATPRVQLGDRGLHSLAAVGTKVASRKPTLQILESLLFSLRQPRAAQELTRGHGGRDGDAAVHAGDLSCTWSGDWRRYDGECNVPSTRPVVRDAVRLRDGYRSGQPKPYPTDLRHVDGGPLPAQRHDPARLRSNKCGTLRVFRSCARSGVGGCLRRSS